MEVKYSLHPSDIDRFVKRKLPNFLRLFPEYKHRRLHPVLATFSVEDEVAELALNEGITLLQRRGELIDTRAA